MVAPETAIDELVGLEDLVGSRNSYETHVSPIRRLFNIRQPDELSSECLQMHLCSGSGR
jgi:hypothetical protein